MAITAAELQMLITADASQAKSEIQSLNGVISGIMVGHQIKDFGEGILDFFGSFVGVGATFEENMTLVDRIIGGTISHLEELKQKAIDADINTMFDAIEVTQGMEMLARAGFDAQQIIGTPGQQNGLIDSLLFFAAATKTDIPIAGQVFASTARIFENSGLSMIEIADLITQGILRSGKSADQFATAFQYVGAISQQFGTAPQDIVTAIALLEQLGVKSQSVGTGLRSLYVGISTQGDSIAALGLNLYEVDAAGNQVLKSLPEIINSFHNFFADKSPEYILQTLTDIFGKPAASPLATLFTTGAENWDRFASDMEEVGSAQSIMEARMNTLRGSIEKFKATWLGLKKVLGDSVSQYIKPIVDTMTSFVDVIQNADPWVHKLIAGLILLTGTFATFVGSAVMFQAVGGMKAVAAVLSLMSAAAVPFVLIIGAVALAVLALKTNFGGITDYLRSVVDHITNFTRRFGEVYDFYRSLGQGPLQSVIRAFGRTLAEELGLSSKGFEKFRTAFGKVADMARGFDAGARNIIGGIRAIGEAFKEGGIQAGIDEMLGKGGDRILNGLGHIIGGIPGVIGKIIVDINWGETLEPAMNPLGMAIRFFGRGVKRLFDGEFRLAWEDFKLSANRLVKSGMRFYNIAVKVASWAISQAVDLWDALKGKVYEWFGGQKHYGPGTGQLNPDNKGIPLGTVAVLVKDWAIAAWDGSVVESLFNKFIGLFTGDTLFSLEHEQKSHQIGEKLGRFMGEWIAKGLKWALEQTFALFFGEKSNGAVADAGRQVSDAVTFDAGDLIKAFLDGFFQGFEDAGEEVFAPWREAIRNWWSTSINNLLDILGGVDGTQGSSQGAHSKYYTGRRNTFTNLLKGILKLDEWAFDTLGMPNVGEQFNNWLDGELNRIKDFYLNNRLARAAEAMMKGDFLEAIRILGEGGGSGSLGKFVAPTFDELLLHDQNRIKFGFASLEQIIEEKRQEFIDNINKRFPTSNHPVLPGQPGGLPKNDPRPTQGPPAPAQPDIPLGVPQAFLPRIQNVVGIAGTLLQNFASSVAPSKLASLAPNLAQKAQQAMSAFQSGITNGFSGAAQVTGQGAFRVWQAAHVPSLYDHGYGVGRSLGLGMADGLISTIGHVLNARARLQSAATSTTTTAPAPHGGTSVTSAASVPTREPEVMNQTNYISMDLQSVEEMVRAGRFVANLSRNRQIKLGTT